MIIKIHELLFQTQNLLNFICSFINMSLYQARSMIRLFQTQSIFLRQRPMLDRLAKTQFLPPIYQTLTNVHPFLCRQTHTQQSKFTPLSPDYATHTRNTFNAQPFLMHIGAQIIDVAPGYVEIHLPYNKNLTQHHGYYHGGVLATLADVSGGFAASTLLNWEKGDSLLTVELKINIMSPAKGAEGATVVSKGQVLKAGKTLITTKADLFWRGPETNDGSEVKEVLVASMLQTIFALRK